MTLEDKIKIEKKEEHLTRIACVNLGVTIGGSLSANWYLAMAGVLFASGILAYTYYLDKAYYLEKASKYEQINTEKESKSI